MTSNICTPIAILILLFIYDWRMALATLAVIPVGLVIMLGQMKGYKEKSELQMQAGNEMNNAIIEYVNGIEVIKAFNQSATSYKKFSDAVRNFRDCTLDWWKGCWIYSSIGYSVISSTLILSLPLGAYWYSPGVFLEPGFHIRRVEVHEALKGHIQISAGLVELFPLPGLCFSFGLEAPLLGLLALAVPVRVAVDRPPSIGLFFLVDRHD